MEDMIMELKKDLIDYFRMVRRKKHIFLYDELEKEFKKNKERVNRELIHDFFDKKVESWEIRLISFSNAIRNIDDFFRKKYKFGLDEYNKSFFNKEKK